MPQRARLAAEAIAGGNAVINTASIVGMWKGQFISQGNTTHNPPVPDGVQLDFGYTQWQRRDGNHGIGGSKAPYGELVHGDVG